MNSCVNRNNILTILVVLIIGLFLGSNIESGKDKDQAVSPVSPAPSKIDLIHKLSAGVQFSYFKSLLGEAVYRNTVEDTDLTEWIFVDPDYYVQAIVDPDEKVLAYAVTSRSDSFKPTFNIADKSITLNQTTFKEIRGDGGALECSSNLGNTAPSWYWELYNYGNPGNYQNYIYAVNNSAPNKGFPSPNELNADTKNTDNACDQINPDDLAKYPLNTIMITDQSINTDPILKNIPYIGPNSIQMRTLNE